VISNECAFVDEGYLGSGDLKSQAEQNDDCCEYNVVQYLFLRPHTTVVMKYLEPLSKIHVPMISMQDCAVVYVK
jgi:hypothetical protein